jgi:glutamate decarboxylase
MSSKSASPTCSVQSSTSSPVSHYSISPVITQTPKLTPSLLFSDYPLPPKEDSTEILRVVVRETMSMDLLDRLIADIFSVTENVMNSDEIDLKVWQPFQNKNSVEKTHGSTGAQAHETHKHKRPMSKGVHRTVC